MKFKILLSFLIIFTTNFILLAQTEYGQPTITPELKELILNVPESSEFPKAKAYWLINDREIEVTDNFGWKEHVHYLIKLYTYKGKTEFSNYKFEYDSTFQEIEIVTARTINVYRRPDTLNADTIGQPSINIDSISVSVIKESNINEITPPYLNDAALYVSRKEMVLSLPAVTESSFVEIEAIIKSNDRPPYPFDKYIYPVSLDPAKESNVTIKSEGAAMNFVENNNIDKASSRLNTHKWSIKEYPGLNLEPNLPVASEYLPNILITQSKSWSELYSFFAKKFLPKILVSEKIQAKAEEIISDKTGIEAVYAVENFLNDEIAKTYVPLGTYNYEPNTAEEVLAHGNGDCRDIAVLTIALLKAKNINSYPVLVSNNGRTINKNIPALSQFNDIIIQVDLGDNIFYIDPFAEKCGYGYIGKYAGQTGFLIGNGSGELITLPEHNTDYNKFELNYSLKLDNNGDLSGKLSVQSFGMYDCLTRNQFRDIKPRAKSMFLEEMITNISSGATLIKDTIGIMNDLGENTEFGVEFIADDFASTQKDMMILELPNNPVSFASIDLQISTDDRKLPLDIEFPLTMENNIIMEIPVDYNVIFVTPSQKVENQCGSISIESSVNNNQLEFKRILRLNKRIYQPEEYKELKEIIRSYLLPKNKFLLLEKKES